MLFYQMKDWTIRINILFSTLLFIGMYSSITYAHINVIDDINQKVTLPKPAKRIISLAPNITEILFHIGAGHQIVGVTEYSNFPPEASIIQVVGGHNRFDIESIISLKPDLIISWDSGNPKEDIVKLKSLGQIVFVSEPRSIAGIGSLMRRLGMLAGVTEEAILRAADFETQIKTITRQFSERKPVKVFYQVWANPIYTLNGEHVISELIHACGGRNIFYDLNKLAPVVSVESVLAKNPQVILGGGALESNNSKLSSWQKWPGIAAVRNKHIYSVNEDYVGRMGPRMVQGMKSICNAIQNARKS